MVLRICVFLFFSISLSAQYAHVAVFENLEGESLRAALVSNYKPDTVLTLSHARDTLYRVIYLEDDSVRCVYSGLTKYLDITEDPSQYLFANGGDTDINLEHGFPRSKGAEFGNASSDMHHLYPSRVPVNSARGSDPLMEINDTETDKWFYKDISLTTIPNQNIELFSEDRDQGFEPREDFKGNIARAYFYFYTMYKSEADAADSNFFEDQLDAICQWHYMDPVDSLEWERNYKIARFQSNRVNPFILDCSLARLYCPEIGESCRTVHTEEVSTEAFFIYPNLVLAGYPIIIESAKTLDARFELRIFDMHGRAITVHTSYRSPNEIEIVSPQNKGIYLLQVISGGKLVASRRIYVL
jgi:hypothetical protein